MIFLPNNFMRYTAALRVYIQRSVLKYGIKSEHLRRLRKIYIAEAILGDEAAIPVDLQSFLSPLMIAIYIIKTEKGLNFNFKVAVRENCMLDLKNFKALILNICRYSKDISIYKLSGQLIIKADNAKIKHSRSLAKKLGGCVYSETKSGKILVTLPFVSTDKKESKSYETVEEYIINPLSDVNIFIR